jgi:hypothetical protein
MVQIFKEYHIHIDVNKEEDLPIKYLCIQVDEVTCIENYYGWFYGYLNLKLCSMMGRIAHEKHVVFSGLL